MTNLLIDSGPVTASDIARGIPVGLFVTEIGHATLNIDEGRFAVEVLLAREIKDGRMGRSLTGFFLGGDVRSALSGVTHVADNFTTGGARGECLKRGQVVPVGVGSPSIRVEGLTVQISPR
jgi:TldD protein